MSLKIKKATKNNVSILTFSDVSNYYERTLEVWGYKEMLLIQFNEYGPMKLNKKEALKLSDFIQRVLK